MTRSHTPGHWTYALEAGRETLHKISGPGGSPRICTMSDGLNDTATISANARLIAAAPDLLLALETLLFNALHGNGLDALQQGHDKARAAIEKATSAS